MVQSQIVHPYVVQIHYNNGDKTRLWIDFDVVGIYEMTYIVLALDEQNVRLQ